PGASRRPRRTAGAARAARAAAARGGRAPPVCLEMDQQDMDEAYDNDVYAFNAKNIDARRVYNNRIAKGILGAPERVAYGPTEIEKLDIYKAKRANAPVMVFIHGGSWRGGRSDPVPLHACTH